MGRRALLTAAGIALLAAGCGDSAAPDAVPASDGCASTGCPTGRTCGADGLCVADGPGPAHDACAASDGCWTERPASVQSVWWDGGQAGLDLVCTVPQASCPGGACTGVTECLPANQDGLPGSFACAADEECASGRCVDTGSVKLCLRSCHGDSDCPIERPAGLPVAGFVCGLVEERGVSMSSCIPADPALPAATLCRRDCDCRPGGGLEDPESCAQAAPGEPRCRLVGLRERDLQAVPLCEIPPEGQLRPTGVPCLHDPESCEGGGCGWVCTAGALGGGRHFCAESEHRCTNACTRDSDCPERLSCSLGRPEERVGDWTETPNGTGRNLSYCQLPGDGCLDQRDCCPEPDGQGGCLAGWTPEPRRCAVTFLPGATRHRLATTCVPFDPGKLTPGACCTSHDECDSALCVPGRVGTACAGGGMCSVPCAPGSDPDGIPGSGDELDRCPTGGLGPTFEAARCQPFLYEAVDPVGAVVAVTVDVCR